MTTLEKIREKCIEANPEIAYCHLYNYGACPNPKCVDVAHQRRIRLADVLLAIDASKISGFAVYQGGQIWNRHKYTMLDWNLRNDDLEQQSPETVEFIGKVLGV